MYTYQDAVDASKKALDQIKELFFFFFKRIIEKDLNDYHNNQITLKKINEHFYLLNDKIEIYSGDGLLTIDDRRNTAFRRVFSLEFDNTLQLSDTVFEGERYVNKIEYMTMTEFESNKVEVENVINKMEQSIRVLSDGTVETWNYRYVSVDPDVEIDCLESVFEYVISNPYLR